MAFPGLSLSRQPLGMDGKFKQGVQPSRFWTAEEGYIEHKSKSKGFFEKSV
jgi:hypothetical protein